MGVFTRSLRISTKAPGDVVDLTSLVAEVVRTSKIQTGIVHVFAPHATGVFALTELESPMKKAVTYEKGCQAKNTYLQ